MDALANLKKLPPMCAIILRAKGEPVIIKRGESGYYPAPTLKQHYSGNGLSTSEKVDAFNRSSGADARHVAAMECGSMFGWEIPAADCDTYTDEGKPDMAKVKAYKKA